jgi:hypothetical protein
MRFRDFERRAREAFGEIPDEYKEGVDGLTVRREAVPHPSLPGVFTLGECVTDEHPSDYGGPETTRSVIELYWGSFRELAERDPDFDWDEELWETLTHELRHHLESLARDDALGEEDYAADELFKREEGVAFDPWYYQHGESPERGVYVVEGHIHLEQSWRLDDFSRASQIMVPWGTRVYRIARPAELGDVHFVRLTGPGLDERVVELVLVRKRGWWDSLRAVARPSRPVVLESEAEAERVDSGG